MTTTTAENTAAPAATATVTPTSSPSATTDISIQTIPPTPNATVPQALLDDGVQLREAREHINKAANDEIVDVCTRQRAGLNETSRHMSELVSDFVRACDAQFWRKVFENYEPIRTECNEKDIIVLSYLRNITYCHRDISKLDCTLTLTFDAACPFFAPGSATEFAVTVEYDTETFEPSRIVTEPEVQWASDALNSRLIRKPRKRANSGSVLAAWTETQSFFGFMRTVSAVLDVSEEEEREDARSGSKKDVALKQEIVRQEFNANMHIFHNIANYVLPNALGIYTGTYVPTDAEKWLNDFQDVEYTEVEKCIGEGNTAKKPRKSSNRQPLPAATESTATTAAPQQIPQQQQQQQQVYTTPEVFE